MEERILKLESEVKELNDKIKLLEERLDRKYKKKTSGIENKDVLEIISKSLRYGTVLEDCIYYYVDKNIVHEIAKHYGVDKRVLNCIILSNVSCVIGASKNNAYFQKRVNGKNVWLYRINKELFTNEIKELSENE